MASIRKRGKGYQIRVSYGYNPDGSQKIETMTWKPDPDKTDTQNERALKLAAAEFEARVIAGKHLDGEKLTFSQFVGIWFQDYAAANMTEVSIANARRILDRHVLPEIGSMRIAKIQPLHLNALYRKMSEQRKDGKAGGYPKGTIQRVHSAISSVMTQAVKWNIIQDNPCRRVTLPKQDKAITEDMYWTLEQADIFLDILDKEFSYQVTKSKHANEYTRSGSISIQLKLFYYIAIYCGLRRGEIVALTWKDIDLENGKIKINKELTLADGKPIEKKPKSKKSFRTVTAPPEVIDLAKKWKTKQLRYRLSIGDQWQGTKDNIFITWNGLQMRPETPYKALKRIEERYNKTHDEKLPEIPLHGLRHTNATLSISQSVDPETVARRLGHAKTSTTLDTYAHALDTKDKEAAETLSGLLRKKKVAQ